MRTTTTLLLLTAALFAPFSAAAAPNDEPSRVPEEFRSVPVDRRPATPNPEGSWRGRIARLTAYPAAEALRFEVVLSSAVDASSGGRWLPQVTVYTDLLPQLRVNDWVVFRGRQFCIRPEASGRLESGHLSGIWEVTLDDRDVASIQDALRMAKPFARAPGAPECSKTF